MKWQLIVRPNKPFQIFQNGVLKATVHGSYADALRIAKSKPLKEK